MCRLHVEGEKGDEADKTCEYGAHFLPPLLAVCAGQPQTRQYRVSQFVATSAPAIPARPIAAKSPMLVKGFAAPTWLRLFRERGRVIGRRLDGEAVGGQAGH
jgi:hypothetical protein